MSTEYLDFLNPIDQEITKYKQPETLTECMQYAKDNDDFEPLECAIFTLEKNLAEAKEVIKFMRETAQAGEPLEFYIKQSNKLLTILNRK